MESMSDEELEAVAELTSRISDLELDKYERQAFSLVRWLRAQGMNGIKAEEMLRKSLEWRKATGIPSELASWEPPPFYSKYFPYWLGSDKEGLPFGICPSVEWDAYVLKELKAGRKTTIHRYLIQINNRIEMDMKSKLINENKVVTEFRIIFDLKRFSLRHLTSIGVTEVTLEYFRLYEANYPGTLKAAYIINAPKLFTFLFELVKRVISSETLSKVEVYDSNSEKWQEALLKHISPDQLPKSYGGTREEFVICNDGGNDGEDVRDSISTQQMTTVSVKAGQTLHIPFDVKTVNQKISWIFKTDHYDIGFSILLNGEDEVFPKIRAESHIHVEEGSFTCKKLGIYTLKFDNSYSKMRAKILHYFVVLE